MPGYGADDPSWCGGRLKTELFLPRPRGSVEALTCEIILVCRFMPLCIPPGSPGRPLLMGRCGAMLGAIPPIILDWLGLLY